MASSLRDRVVTASKSISSRFSDIRTNVADWFNRFKNNFKSYDLFKEIKDHPWRKAWNTAWLAIEWYDKYKKDRKNWIKGQLMIQGGMYMFDYKDPKYKDTLPWFDENPLILCLGRVKTSLGWRTININLHLLPPLTRRIVLSKIFDMNKSMYKKQLGSKTFRRVVIKYAEIITPLRKYGVEFAIRMYIPELQKNVIEFKMEDWKNAIYIESKKLNKITVKGLQLEWEKFVREHHEKTGVSLNRQWIKN